MKTPAWLRLSKNDAQPGCAFGTHDENKVLRANGDSHKEVRRFKVERILKEAYSQDGVLS